MLKLAICDDNRDDLRIIKTLVNEYEIQSGTRLSATDYHNGNQLLDAIEDGRRYQIYLLDIIMPSVNGIEIAARIRRHDETAQIIFLTSSAEYAVDSYHVNAASYLLKPIEQKQLFGALTKAVRQYSAQEREGILLHENGKLRHISFNGIEFVEVRLDKLYFYLNSNERLTSYGTMKELDKVLMSRNHFIKPHRSYIVNMDYIQIIETNELHVSGHFPPVPISRNYIQQLKSAYIDYMVQMTGEGAVL